MTRKLVPRFKPEKIVLFGSYAYGRPDTDSDIDLLFVVPHRCSAASMAAEIRLALPDDVPIDVLVRSPKALAKRLSMNDFFIRDILEKGKTLYEARDA